MTNEAISKADKLKYATGVHKFLMSATLPEGYSCSIFIYAPTEKQAKHIANDICTSYNFTLQSIARVSGK